MCGYYVRINTFMQSLISFDITLYSKISYAEENNKYFQIKTHSVKLNCNGNLSLDANILKSSQLSFEMNEGDAWSSTNSFQLALPSPFPLPLIPRWLGFCTMCCGAMHLLSLCLFTVPANRILKRDFTILGRGGA
jgi:hypothetical protein